MANVAGKPQAPEVPLKAPEPWARPQQPATEAAKPSLIGAVAGGGSLVPDFFADARKTIQDSGAQTVLAASYSLRDAGASEDFVRALQGMALLRISGPEAAWRQFELVGDDRIINLCPDEYFAAAFTQDPDRAAKVLTGLLADGAHLAWSAQAVLRVARRAFARDELDAARVLVSFGLGGGLKKLSAHTRGEFERLQTWFPEGERRQPITVPAADANFGVLSYQQPDAWSRNVGDYIQTLASLGHLVRHANLEFVGDPELTGFLNEIRSQVKDERRIIGPAATVAVLETYRDGSPLQDIPENTWILAFGWYMHHTFGQHFNFPFHPNIRPIFVSFHVNKPAMLTPEAIAYLKEHGPVGCRDWQTVALLRAAGVPAFFSGCITTTVDTVFRRDGEDTRSKIARVDALQPGEGDVLLQTQKGMLQMPFAQKLETARSWVNGYHTDYKQISTSRLHCFLPARSVGCEVEFEPKNRSDVRFGGLIGTSQADFDAIRNGILDKLAEVIPLIASGAGKEEVYARWAEVCAPAMAEADRFLARRPQVVLEDDVVARLAAAAAPATVQPDGEVTDVVLDHGQGSAGHLAKLLRSIADHADGNVRVWMAEDGVPAEVREAAEALQPQLQVVWLAEDAFAADELAGSYPYLKRRELLLALMPEIMAGSKRAVYLNGAALVRADLAGLAGLSLQGKALAARDEHRMRRQSGFGLLRLISERHHHDDAKALEMIAVTHAAHAFDFRVFDASVLVMDLEAAREAGLGRKVATLLLNYEMDFGEALNAVVGPERAVLPDEWNHSALIGTDEDPKIMNWRDTQKPWSDGYGPFVGYWRSM
ncbi:hypothetical protein [Arthrobacter mobilis]|uniref:Uncharacterized protein n=1 Tax=Arthrobacter mobilis TaxID=2724944 RepID=A0A7X6K7D1_9MICC|nr:hypothetical protein [Arthrobacter mobilis]NKX56489.1 hypothetical protein [Arthrobacter mobilis]